MNTTKKIYGLLVFLALLLTAQQSIAAPFVNQAAYQKGTTSYVFGHRSISNLSITGAPVDTDWNRWAMMYDRNGGAYRLFFFKAGTNDILYQFGFNTAAKSYQFGYQAIPAVRIVGMPYDTDVSNFSVLHDGRNYKLYMPRSRERSTFYEFAFNLNSKQYEYTNKALSVTGMPSDTDWQRTSILHDGVDSRFFAMKSGTNNVIYQAAYNPTASNFQYNFRSIPMLTLVGTPTNSNTRAFSMLFDGNDYRLYFLTF
ncbi:MAG: hypothetical protein GQ569_06435 [Methylococcaceae bacterium]|nr:hypothetical protein [Methylococcaceae bacterium]